ncbi:MAG: hypothetical protein EA365_09840 [Gloeocapsa sp. DLM2.Bin57]|nr:MAG: hypothetical protein EA365_09840 [Gloeocapsa sp. DLM2.Bin57]
MSFGKLELFFTIQALFFLVISCVLTFIFGIRFGLVTSFLVTLFMSVFFRYPRLGLWLLLLYLPFAGTVVYAFDASFDAKDGYIVYHSFSWLLHLIKDFFYIPALLYIVINTKIITKFFKQYLKLGLVIFVIIASCLLTFLLVNIPENTVLMGLVGLKVFLGYIPLILCGYYLIRNTDDLLIVSRLHISLIIICCLLGLVQYLLLINNICPGNSDLLPPANSQPSLQARCLVGGSLLYNPEWGLIRLPGTFVAPWQWGWFLIANSFLAFGGYLIEKEIKWRCLSIIGMVLLILATLVSRQRVAILLIPLILVTLFFCTGKYQNKIWLKLGLFMLIFLTLEYFNLPEESLANFLNRWEYSPPQDFIVSQFQWLIRQAPGLLGKGLGTTDSAARHWGRIYLVEIFPVKVIYEIGILGWTVWMILVSYISRLTYLAYNSAQISAWRSWGMCIWLFILLISYNLWYYPLVVDPVNVYYWFFIGVLLKLPQIRNNNYGSNHNFFN